MLAEQVGGLCDVLLDGVEWNYDALLLMHQESAPDWDPVEGVILGHGAFLEEEADVVSEC